MTFESMSWQSSPLEILRPDDAVPQTRRAAQLGARAILNG